MKLKDYIEEIPDFPVKGILFKDISPLLANYQAMSYVKKSFLDIIKSYNVDIIAGIDARGFLFSVPADVLENSCSGKGVDSGRESIFLRLVPFLSLKSPSKISP